MEELEYQIVMAVDVAAFNTAIKALYEVGWCSNNNIVVAADGKIYQEWCRAKSWAAEPADLEGE